MVSLSARIGYPDSGAPSNTYIIKHRPRSEPITIDIDLFDGRLPDKLRLDYVIGALRFMEAVGTVKGKTFYLTYDCIHDLPSYGDDVVALIYGDEANRIPDYVDKVGMIFKCYGATPINQASASLRWIDISSAIKYVRECIRWTPGFLNYARLKLTQQKICPLLTMPLGYAAQEPIPLKPFRERTFFLSFVGSVNHFGNPSRLRQLFKSPKVLAREQMAASIAKIKRHEPEIEIFFGETANFHSSLAAGGDRYSSIMMDTKICLVPRGTSLETFRLYEAARYGCVVICERLPRRWYLDDLPRITVRSWDELPELAAKLHADPERLFDLHQQTLAFWDAKCSEAALGTYLADRISGLEWHRHGNRDRHSNRSQISADQRAAG